MDADGPGRPKTRWYTSQQIPRTPPDQNPGTPPRTPSRQSRASSHVSSNKTSSSLRVLKRAKADATWLSYIIVKKIPSLKNKLQEPIKREHLLRQN